MPTRRPRSSRAAAAVAAVVGFATLALASPALGQADPGASSTTAVEGATTTASVVDPSSTVADPTSSTADTTEVTETTAPAPVVVDAPFPVALVAPVPPVEGKPDSAITDLYVTDGVDAQSPDVVVQFKEPFTFAGTPYRVGVVIGDPSGTRLRTWLISNGPDALPYGRVERFEAGSWTNLGATTVRFENGLMVITIPIEQAPGGGAVWAEIVENDADTPSYTTPFFSRDAFFGTADAGTIPSGIFGRVFGLDGVNPEIVAELPTGGVLVSIDDRIAVTYPDPPPREVIGVPVTAAVDTIRISPDYDGGSIIAHFVRFDRTTGEVGLYDGFSPVPIDRTGDRSWLLQAPAAGEAGSLVLDRAAIARALDLPDGGAGIALGVSREVALEDGRVVTAEGVLGTDAWLDLAPASALAEVTTTVAPAPAPVVDEPTASNRLPLLIGAGVGLVVLLVLVVLVRRTRGRNEESADIMGAMAGPTPPKADRMPWGSTDGGLIITTTHEFDALIPADATPLPTPSPIAPATTAPLAAAGSGVRILGTPVTAAPATPDPSPAPVDPAQPAPSPTAPSVPVAREPGAVEPGAVEPAPVEPAPVESPVGTSASPVEATPEPAGTLDAEPVWAAPAPVAPEVAGVAAVAAAVEAPAAPDAAAATDPVAAAPPAAPVAGVALRASPSARPGPASGVAPVPSAEPPAGPTEAVDPTADGEDDDDEAPTALEPGRVDPMAALSALDQDLAELRKRVAGLGDS